jgi:hypothetical protein
MDQPIYTTRISDLPREQRLSALYRRSAEARAQWQAERARPASFWQRLLGR